MSQRFSERLDPWRLVDAGETIEGVIPLRSFPRLVPLLSSTKGEANFVLRFDRDEQRRGIISGEIKAELTLTCQRCLEPMPFRLELKSRMALVSGFLEAEQLPIDLDPLLLEENDLVVLKDQIEEELLLAIPSAPKHEETGCQLHARGTEEKADSPMEEGDRENPFAVLAALNSSDPED